jgi:hypothetical protein
MLASEPGQVVLEPVLALRVRELTLESALVAALARARTLMRRALMPRAQFAGRRRKGQLRKIILRDF